MKGIKYTTILPAKIDRILEELSEKQQTTKADILRKAIYVYEKLYNELSDKNNKLYIIDKDNKNTKELII